MEREVKNAKARAGAKATAKKAPAKKAPPARAAVDDRTTAQRLADALAQQTATHEILRVMSASPSDVMPVLHAVSERAAILCHAPFARLLLVDGDHVRPIAPYSAEGESEIPVRAVVLQRTSLSGRAILDRTTLHHADVVPLLDTEYPDARDNAIATGFRAVLLVPLVHRGEAYGTIFLWRREPGLFAPDHVALVETFATQAAIAIANVRQFHATRDALEQQTATSEILRVISSSPTNVQPVFDIIAEHAVKLCGGEIGIVSQCAGEWIELRAVYGVSKVGVEAVRHRFPLRPDEENVTSRVVRTQSVVQLHDALADATYDSRAEAELAGWRGSVGVPMLRDGQVIGAIFIARRVAGEFAVSQIELLKTFADQAVIAVENVRLFKELEARNGDLAEALEQQTATSEILRVMSQSQTDVQPVFATIAAAALKLCSGGTAIVTTYDGALITLAAMVNLDQDGAEAVRQIFPRPPSRDNATARAILTCDVVQIPDLLLDLDYAVGTLSLRAHFRSNLSVPLVREGIPIGAITVGRPEPGPFSETQVALLQTFADQAVIAIENVRLVTELEARTAQLTQSVGELKALSEVGQAVSSTLDLATVLNTIVERATQLTGMDGGSVYEFDEVRGEFHLHSVDRLPEELVEAIRTTPMREGEGALGRMALTREPVQIHDIANASEYQSRVRNVLVRLGYRSLLAVPLLRDGRVLGGLAVNRKSVGAFAPEVVKLLQTFAAQSALAIQNARLFREIEVKSRQLEIASQHKSEFLANMSHELRTPLNAIIGFSEVLTERLFGDMNDKQAEYVHDITESGRHLLSLINDILDLSKIEAGRMELDVSEFSVAAAVDSTLTLVRERAQRRAIALECSVDERDVTVKGDERKVRQVLLNLLSNALKFTPEGGRVAVGVRTHDDRVEVTVADTGVGIAADELEAVFEEFRQVGAAAKKIEGTGLGLAISRKFIELHNGKIWVTSQPGVGSTFAFTLPRR